MHPNQPSHIITTDTILESISDGFVFYDTTNTVRYWNSQAEKLVGLTKQEAIGRNIWDCFPEEVGRGFYKQYEKALKEQITVHFEDYLARADRWFEITAYPSKEGLAIYFRNVSDRKKREQELEEIKQRFEYVLKATCEAIGDYDLVQNKGYWHGENFKKLFGYNIVNNKAPYESWEENVHPDDVEKIKTGFEKAINNDTDFYTDIYRFKKVDGSYAIVRDRSSIIRDAVGNPIRVISAIEDITERRVAEEILAENEKKYKSLFNNGPLPQWIIDIETLRILDVNEAAIWQYGYTREEFLNKTLLDMRPENNQEAFLNLYNKEDKNTKEGVWMHKKKNGNLMLVEIRSTVVNYNGGLARLATINDITDKELVKENLQKSKNNYERLFNNAPLPQYILDKETLRIIKVNVAARTLYGYTEAEFLKMTPFDLRAKEEHYSLKASIKLLIDRGENLKITGTHKIKNGQTIIVELNSVIILYEGKNCILVTIRNITSERVLEQKILELKVASQKLITKTQVKAQETEREAIGRELHDNINQQLTTVRLYMDLAIAREDLRMSLLQKSEKVVNHAIEEIRNLSKSLISPVLKDIGLRQALEELNDSFRTAQKFEIHLLYANKIDEVEEDLKLCFYRIIQEQLTNISKYAEAKNVWIDFEMEDANISITVRDDGKGFDPTKIRTGVGLANIKNRIDLYNGAISIDSAPGNGCALHIRMPYDCHQQKIIAGGLYIAIAEDNTDDQSFLQEAFDKIAPNCKLVFKNNGIELLEHLQSLSNNALPHLIVLDFNMPLLNGLDTLMALHLDARFSRIPKIVYSTSSDNAHKQKSMAAFATAYIEKGLTRDEIMENVRQMLSLALYS